MFTRRHAPDTGAVQWEVRRPSGSGTSSHGVAIAIDAAGDVVVTGITGWWNSMSIPYGNVLSVRYEGASGRLLWSATYDGVSGSFDSGWDVVSSGDSVYVVAGTREGAAGRGIRAWKFGPGSLPSPNHQGRGGLRPREANRAGALASPTRGILSSPRGSPTTTAGGRCGSSRRRCRDRPVTNIRARCIAPAGPLTSATAFDPADVRAEELGNASVVDSPPMVPACSATRSYAEPRRCPR